MQGGRRQARPYAAPVGADELETAVLGAASELDRDEVAALAGVPEEQARAIWSAMGFAEVPAGERAFTRRDAEALQLTSALRDSGVLDLDTLLVLARATGQAMSRLAESQVGVLRVAASDLEPDEAVRVATAAAAEVLPGLERLVVHVWRRQLAAALTRSLTAARHEGLPVLAVGFVDLVGFTRTSREFAAADLERLLEHFERDTSLRVAAVGGRVVKTLGDAVLWVCDDASAAAEVAVDTVQAHADDPDQPDVRAGLALGPVLVRLGDVFGQPVNLASRLTDEARPGTVLVDLCAAEVLGHDPRWQLQRLHSRPVRGYRSLRPHLLRRAT